MTIVEFADQFGVRISRDECGDRIIPGKRGHLYFDGGELCLMVIDGQPANRSRWAALGGKLWMGDISPNAEGRRVQDVWIKNVPLENAKAAMKMVRIRRKRVMSAEALVASRARAQKAREALSGRRFPAPETPAEADWRGR